MLRRLAVVGLWLLIWEGLSLLVGTDLLLPGPLRVGARLAALAGESAFYVTILRSFLRIMSGFLLGCLAGILLGILTSRFAFASEFIALPMNLIKASPVASFVILALVWLSGRNLSIFICFLMVLPIVWSSTDQGLRSVDPQLLEVAEVYRFSAWKRIRFIHLHALMPYLISGLRVAIGFAWKAGIAGEVIAVPSGTIGKQLHDAKIYLETTDLFAWTVVVILLSILLEKLLMSLLGRYGRKEETAS